MLGLKHAVSSYRSWWLLAFLLLALGAEVHAQPAAETCRRPAGLIGERYDELGGLNGPLGCTNGVETPVGTNGARAVSFINGAYLVYSPAQGQRMVVAGYQQENNLIVSWGDSLPQTYSKWLVHWTRGDRDGQADLEEYVSNNRGFYAINKPVPGTYSVSVKGCKGTDCSMQWTHPVVVTYKPPLPPRYARCTHFSVSGLIAAKWAEKGGGEGDLGCPTGPESAATGQAGRVQTFEKGQIATSPQQGDGLTVLLVAVQNKIVY